MEYDDIGQLGEQKGYMPSRTSLASYLRQERCDVHLVRSLREKIICKMSVLLRNVSFTTPSLPNAPD